MDFNLLKDVTIDLSARRSINYAKARAAIENVASCRKDKRAAKQAIIDHLQGTVVNGEPDRAGMVKKTVVFPDNSSAKY